MARTKARPYQEHAEELAAELRPDTRWDATKCAWYRRSHTSGIWRIDETGITEYDIHRSALRMDADDSHLAANVRKVLIHHPELAVTAAVWDRDAHLIGTPGGVFDLDDGEIVGPVTDHLVTRQTGCRIGHPGDCPRWRGFLAEACSGDEARVGYLQRWAGYCLSGYTHEHAMLFIHGPGGNGKGTFIETVQHCLGEYAKTLPMDSLMERDADRHPADIAMLAGARLAVANETKDNRRWDEARIKTMTGGDTLTARFMRENYFHFVPCFKLCVVGNHAPTMGQVDEAMRRRLQIVPFTNAPAKVDQGLREALKAESRGILAWAVEGFKEWRRVGLNPPDAVLAATADYFDDEDLLGQFLIERMERAEGAECATSDIRKAYGEWAEANGVGAKSAKRLAGELKKRGYAYRRRAGWRGFQGLRVAAGHGGYLVGEDDR